ncbi:hypothetical protein SAMN04490182_0327 [Pseudomonas cedrina]|nr:hypothetical protein [Pseudomonas cedrina]SDR92930.1 hypothetical protein SAMN04490182_0327 [Pseudomonas cedrina]
MKFIASGLLCLLGAIVARPAIAESVDITAVFRPDGSAPQKNQFVNTTPESGYCLIYKPDCTALRIFSIRLPLRIDSARPMRPSSEPRDNAMFQVPSQWRAVDVTNTVSGETARVEVRIAGIGSTYFLSDTVQSLTGAATAVAGHHALWGSSWLGAPSPCLGTYVGFYGSTSYGFFWRTPVQSACVKTARFTIPSMYYQYLDFAYELRTPNPLSMTAGIYTGSFTYSLGPGADFDFGDVMLPQDNQLTFNFNLDVDHNLKVQVPPGGHRIQLEPQGGWQAWLNDGRKPRRLFRDQTVNLWTSSPFKMTLECGEPLGNTCSVRNGAGHQVPLDVAVSLPFGLTDGSGNAVNRRPLRLDGSGTELFKPSLYIDRKPSTLHFEIKADAVEQMLEQAGSTYSGTVTVVWDSQV